MALLSETDKECAFLRKNIAEMELTFDKERDLKAYESKELREELAAGKKKYE